MMKSLSTQQQRVISLLGKHETMSRIDFFNCGIRMPTVVSLVRNGLVISEWHHSMAIRVYHLPSAGENS